MNRILILILSIISTSLIYSAAPAATDVMKKAAATISPANGVTVTFKITGNQSISGKMVVSGRKFFLDAGKSKIWYDGTTMTTLNLNTNEATLTSPTQEEVNEVFPLSYITGWSKDYTVAYTKSQPAKGYCLLLTSKNSQAVAKKAVLTVNSSNFKPQKLVISLKRGGTVTVTITRISSGGTSIADGFRFPSNKYPGVKIINLK